jgi:hypothetical protein
VPLVEASRDDLLAGRGHERERLLARPHRHRRQDEDLQAELPAARVSLKPSSYDCIALGLMACDSIYLRAAV